GVTAAQRPLVRLEVGRQAHRDCVTLSEARIRDSGVPPHQAGEGDLALQQTDRGTHDLFGLDEIVSHHLSLESCRPPVWIGRSSPGDEPGKFSGVYLFGLHLRLPTATKARLRTVRRGTLGCCNELEEGFGVLEDLFLGVALEPVDELDRQAVTGSNATPEVFRLQALGPIRRVARGCCLILGGLLRGAKVLRLRVQLLDLVQGLGRVERRLIALRAVLLVADLFRLADLVLLGLVLLVDLRFLSILLICHAVLQGPSRRAPGAAAARAREERMSWASRARRRRWEARKLPCSRTRHRTLCAVRVCPSSSAASAAAWYASMNCSSCLVGTQSE